MTNICFFLTFLTIPLFIEALDLQSKLSLSSTDHTIVEGLIVLVIYWLIWTIVRFDRWLYLRNLAHEKQNQPEQNRWEIENQFSQETGAPSQSMKDINPPGRAEKLISQPSSHVPARKTDVIFVQFFKKNGQ